MGPGWTGGAVSADKRRLTRAACVGAPKLSSIAASNLKIADFSDSQSTPDPTDPYRAIQAAGKRLQDDQRDVRALIEVVQLYARLGLRGPARELICLAPSALHADLNSATVGPSGRVVWGTRTELFEKNLQALQMRGISVDALRNAWNTERRVFELYVDSRDVQHVRVQIPAGGWQWAPALLNHPAIASAAPPPRDHGIQLPGPYLFDGVGLGLHFQKVWRESRNTFLGYNAAIFVIEPDCAAFAAILHLQDWGELLADESVFVFLGPNAQESFENTLSGDDNIPIPTLLFREPLIADRPAGRSARTDDAVQRIITRRDDAYAKTIEAWSRQPELHSTAYWNERFQSAWVRRERPLRVLAAVSMHTTFLQHAMRDALHAMEQLGCKTRLLSDPRSFEKISLAAHHNAVREFDPDVLLSIDHLRSQTFDRIPRGLPQLTWDQDNLPNAFSDAAVRAMGPHDVVVGLAHIEVVARGCAAPARFLASQMPTSERRFHPDQVDPARLAEFRCDMSFVSHASQTPLDFHAQERARLPSDPARTLLDHLFALCNSRPASAGSIDGGETRSLLRQAENDTGVRVADAAMRERLESWYVWRLCDRLFRHQALEWAADWARRTGRSLRIYGNGWERHPTLAPFAAGNVANNEDLIHVYAGSSINLQLMPAGFLHQRALDGLATGGFFLTRRTRADRRDDRLPRLWAEICDLGFGSIGELLATAPAELQTRFLDVGKSLGYDRSTAACTFEYLRFDRQWDYAEEVFADFASISFDDADTFESGAERFLQNPLERILVAKRMRETVIQRYSYTAKMTQFIHFLTDFLSQQATLESYSSFP